MWRQLSHPEDDHTPDAKQCEQDRGGQTADDHGARKPAARARRRSGQRGDPPGRARLQGCCSRRIVLAAGLLGWASCELRRLDLGGGLLGSQLRLGAHCGDHAVGEVCRRLGERRLLGHELAADEPRAVGARAAVFLGLGEQGGVKWLPVHCLGDERLGGQAVHARHLPRGCRA